MRDIKQTLPTDQDDGALSRLVLRAYFLLPVYYTVNIFENDLAMIVE